MKVEKSLGKLASPKASFDNCYVTYSPKNYCISLLKELDYRLPFRGMGLLKSYLSQEPNCPDTIETLIIGSGHGLDSAALKYSCTYENMLSHWGNDPEAHKFTDGDPRFRITMADINEAPLHFAHNAGLCSDFFVCDMSKALPEKLTFHLKSKTDLAICTGAVTYIGIEGFRNLVRILFKEGDARYFCFSLLDFMDDVDAYLNIIRNEGLQLHKLGSVKQRNYKNEDERRNILNAVRIRRGGYAAESEECLMASIYVASRAHLQGKRVVSVN